MADATTLALTGTLPFVVLVASGLSLPVCWLLLGLYRRAVVRGMGQVAGVQADAPDGPPAPRPPAAELRLQHLDATEPDPADQDDGVVQRARRAPWRAAAVYAGAGVAYAAVMVLGWLLATGDERWVGSKLALLGLNYAWVGVLAVWLVAAYDPRRRRQLLGGYFGALVLLMIWVALRNPALGALELPLLWLITNGPASVLLLCFLARPIRAVGPLVLAFMLVAAIGSQSLVSLAAADESVLRAIAAIGFGLGLGGHAVFFAMIGVGLLAFAAAGWPLLRALGRRYEARRFSEQSITIDSLFLLFGVVQSLGLAFNGPGWVLTGLVAFAAYKLVAALAWSRLLPEPAPRTLLLLRVFRLGRRSEALFDKLRRHWQPLGPVAMIAGPDLVTSTVEPHEFLDFVGGHLGRRFVTGAADFAQRLAAIDRRPDPDGRHRIHEFFCRNDTWQLVMRGLAAGSDAVLMDLRSFAPGNDGCVYELGRLLDEVELSRVLLLIDASTDRSYLEATLRRLWQGLADTSPNRRDHTPALRLFAASRVDEKTMAALLSQLLAPSAGPGRG